MCFCLERNFIKKKNGWIDWAGGRKKSNGKENWFIKKWGWLTIQYFIAEERIFGNINEIHNTPIQDIIIYLIYKEEKMKYDKQVGEQQEEFEKLKNENRKKLGL